MLQPPTASDISTWKLERRADGALIVRVPPLADSRFGRFDAVFAFRAGDPQYVYWLARLEEQERDAEMDLLAG